MAGTFPNLAAAGGLPVMLPLGMTYQSVTRVHRAQNGALQRHVARAPYVTIEATYTNLQPSDIALIDTFFNSQKGAFDSTWSMEFDGKTFSNRRFMEDAIAWEETLSGRWTTRLTSFGPAPMPGSPPSSLPALASGAMTQRPWTRRRTFDTNFIDLESGPRYAAALRAGGLTNFPTEAARGWQLEYRAIRKSDLDNLVAFWLSKSGRFGSFDFTDPDSATTYTGCYFGSDELAVLHNGYDNCSLTLTIEKP